MSGHVACRVRRGFYLDSIALMRAARELEALDGVQVAALLVGTPANQALLQGAGLLTEDGRAATERDVIIGIRAGDPAALEHALAQAEALLERPRAQGGNAGAWHPKTLRTALRMLPQANLALISLPGPFAAAEAHKALRAGLHVLLFSDNVPLAEEIALKQAGRALGLLVMGPDCGTALVNGTPLAFANEVPRGPVGIVSASGTGLQEVSTLLARLGSGVSHGLGTGGRDLHADVGGTTMLMAIDALDADAATERIVLISKPPAAQVAEAVLARAARSAKPFAVCFLGLEPTGLPPNVVAVPTLQAAAEWAAERPLPAEPEPAHAPARRGDGTGVVRGLFAGGTLCAEAQVIFLRAGQPVHSNVPVRGAARLERADPAKEAAGRPAGHSLLDLGADEYTRSRPHPMIDPEARDALVREAVADPAVTVVLADLVLGHGAHPDPARGLAAAAGATSAAGGPRCQVVASVCGTDADPQQRAAQIETLRAAGIHVAPSNAAAAELALRLAGGPASA